MAQFQTQHPKGGNVVTTCRWALGILSVLVLLAFARSPHDWRSEVGLAGLPSTADLCATSLTAYKRMPLALEVPLSPDYSSQDPGAFVKMALKQGMTVKVNEVARNISLYVYLENDVIGSEIMASGGWESDMIGTVIAQLYAFAQDNGLVPEEVYLVDIGANIGTYSIAAAAHGFKVLALEAMYSNAQALSLSSCVNPGVGERVTIINKGLGNASSTCVLMSVGDNYSNGFLRCGADANTLPPWGGIKRATLDIVRLDDALEPHFGLLKGRVVEGGRRFFGELQPPFIITECDDKSLLAQTGHMAGPLFSMMAGLGYGVYNEYQQEVQRDRFDDYKCGFLATIYYKTGGAAKR